MKIFYDGQCPLCAKEMTSLKHHDTENKISLIDIHSSTFDQDYPNINKQRALSILHGLDSNNNLLLGLDVTYQAWRTVNKYKWLIVLRKPPIKWFADKAYLFFAKHRMKISGFLVPNQCNKSGCNLK
jgi:predicted DCC family thiol-disulfide oxidoreductase YuxK